MIEALLTIIDKRKVYLFTHFSLALALNSSIFFLNRVTVHNPYSASSTILLKGINTVDTITSMYVTMHNVHGYHDY